MTPETTNELLTPAEVAQMFRVSPKTVTRWSRAGRISAVRTLGGHRRYRADEVRLLLGKIEHGDPEPSDVAPRAPHPDA